MIRTAQRSAGDGLNYSDQVIRTTKNNQSFGMS